MIKFFFVVGVFLFFSTGVLADAERCIQPLRHTQGLSSTDLQTHYLLRIHKTLAGELDPMVLGDGGIITATWIAGVQPTKNEATIFFVIFESDNDYPTTAKIDKSYFKGWPFLLLKADCLAPMQNERQMKVLQDLVTRHLSPPRNSLFKFYMFR